jgi:hypothetical protein
MNNLNRKELTISVKKSKLGPVRFFFFKFKNVIKARVDIWSALERAPRLAQRGRTD